MPNLIPGSVKTGPDFLPLYGSAPGWHEDNACDRGLAADCDLLTSIFDCGEWPRYGGTKLPWVTMPAAGRRIREIGAFPVSGATFTDDSHPVLTFQCPVGYDGVIDTVICGIDPDASGATGFVQGSGALIWRLDANGRYLRDVGNIQFSLGSLEAPTPTTNSGLRIYSGNLLTFSVVFPVSGDGIINPAATIVCAAFGWVYPR